MAIKVWSKAKSKAKANVAASGAAKGAVAGGGIAAVLVVLRNLAPALLPWGPEQDQEVIAAVMTLGLVLAPLWAWVQIYVRDKAKHDTAVFKTKI